MACGGEIPFSLDSGSEDDLTGPIKPSRLEDQLTDIYTCDPTLGHTIKPNAQDKLLIEMYACGNDKGKRKTKDKQTMRTPPERINYSSPPTIPFPWNVEFPDGTSDHSDLDVSSVELSDEETVVERSADADSILTAESSDCEGGFFFGSSSSLSSQDFVELQKGDKPSTTQASAPINSTCEGFNIGGEKSDFDDENSCSNSDRTLTHQPVFVKPPSPKYERYEEAFRQIREELRKEHIIIRPNQEPIYLCDHREEENQGESPTVRICREFMEYCEARQKLQKEIWTEAYMSDRSSSIVPTAADITDEFVAKELRIVHGPLKEESRMYKLYIKNGKEGIIEKMQRWKDEADKQMCSRLYQPSKVIRMRNKKICAGAEPVKELPVGLENPNSILSQMLAVKVEVDYPSPRPTPEAQETSQLDPTNQTDTN